MTHTIHQPNDKLFKKSMEDPRVVRGILTTNLPQALLKAINLETLGQESTTMVSNIFKTTEADIIYSAKLYNGQTAYFYFLCEQQTEVDAMLPFRLLVYTVGIMQAHEKKNRKGPLPIVYPLVLYSGAKEWTAPRDIFDLFGEHKALAKEILFKPFHLIDLQRMDDEDLQKEQWSGLMQYALKYQQVKDLESYLDKLFPWLDSIEIFDGRDMTRFVLHYLLDGTETKNTAILIKKAKEYLS